MIKQIRIGILIAIIGLSVFTEFFVVIQLLFPNIFAVLAGMMLGLLIAVCIREIGRVRKE